MGTISLAVAMLFVAAPAMAQGNLPPGVEAISFLGDTLRPLPLGEATRALHQARLDSARAAFDANPGDPDAIIWLGRRTAYLGAFREAIAVFSRGAGQFPADARFLRHRGHRWLSVRQPDRAVTDLERAARLIRGTADTVEPDGLPNARGMPTSTLHTNVWYHLGLAHYLRGNYRRAREAWQACLEASRNPDMDVASRYWLYLTLRRLRLDQDAAAVLAPVHAGLDIIENRSYHRLLLVFKGDLPADSVLAGEGVDLATTSYGLGAFALAQGDATRAENFFRRAMSGGQWPAFGYLAAEAELARRGANRD